ncbi:zinc finger BED domain-containing protein RICESLEEPER 1-like [Juglans microcarpa x Juglans regia]|uniref:zinc finger BED domain-containing protein RICESLEEPER 1-like n=1 Tax=Juglans microcarpa x Juglans regia TaxID=2249226 RepID=UPI001B7E1EFE|nr:zinc finger BED domain-containing protein RICESLEEPER 1-like [Juglans microcarpa x Juglans regia]
MAEELRALQDNHIWDVVPCPAKIIKFCQITDHKGETIGKALKATIKQWGLPWVLTVSVDNALSNDVALGYLKTYLREANKTFLGGEYLHVRYVAHIVNIIVTKELKDVDDSVVQVRMAVNLRRLWITSKKGFCTDVPTRWNSTFLMLEAAQEYKAAFQLFGDEDIQYVKYFDEHEGLEKPNDDDWELSGFLYPTSYEFCQQICRVKEELDDMCMLYGLELAHDHVWADLIGDMAQDTLAKLYEEFNAIKDRTASTIPTTTPMPSPDTRLTKKHRLAWTKTLT